jgi:anti-sigma B factor antagonist
VTNPGTNDRPDGVWRLRLAQERRDGLLVVTVDGRIGSAEAPRLTAILTDAIAAGHRRIVLDLKGVDYISGAGVIALEAAAARLSTAQGELTLAGVTAPVRLSLELAGFPADVRLL